MRRHALIALAVTAVMTLASPATAQAAGFSDPFTTFDSQRWAVGDHALGLGRFEPANVSVAGGTLALTLSAGTLNGGEVRTDALWTAGRFPARMKAAPASGRRTSVRPNGQRQKSAMREAAMPNGIVMMRMNITSATIA